MNKEFRKKSINRDLIWGCLTNFGAENLSKEEKSKIQYHLKGLYDGKAFLFNIFENKDGTTTVGFSQGFDRAIFELLAEEIIRCCSYGDKERFELSIPRFKDSNFNGLKAFLLSEDVTVEEEKQLDYGGLQSRWKGPNGDTLIIKTFKNGTIQFQGKNAHLASLVWDYLINVLSLEDTISKQSETYQIKLTIDELKKELEAEIPVAHQFIEDTVRRQLSAALMLSKIALPLEDYASVAFPALRGLEGFIKQVLIKSGLKPDNKTNIGEYFEKFKGTYILPNEHATFVGIPYIGILEKSYNFYYNQRHGLFHMATHVETSRILGSCEDAKRIVVEVFNIIEVSCKELCK